MCTLYVYKCINYMCTLIPHTKPNTFNIDIHRRMYVYTYTFCVYIIYKIYECIYVYTYLRHETKQIQDTYI